VEFCVAPATVPGRLLWSSGTWEREVSGRLVTHTVFWTQYCGKENRKVVAPGSSHTHHGEDGLQGSSVRVATVFSEVMSIPSLRQRDGATHPLGAVHPQQK
jgi:hypothetical protein